MLSKFKNSAYVLLYQYQVMFVIRSTNNKSYQSAYVWGLFNVKKIMLELGKIFVSSCSK